jgi:putative salt-induced outer membrane protein YdiY
MSTPGADTALSPSSVVVWVVVSLCALTLTCARASAQVPAGPWIGSAGAGLSFTAGNTDTANFNASYDLTYDPKTKNVVKSDALFLRAKTDGALTVSRLGVNARDQYRLARRVYTFGQLQYLRDQFKAIDYLLASTAGLGYKLVDAPQTTLDVDGGLGAVWEKNSGFERTASGAVTASEHLMKTLSDTARVTQQIVGLWKMTDVGDALYTFGTALAANLTSKSQVKIELLDTYKAKPPTAAIKRNDVAIVFSIGYKL